MGESKGVDNGADRNFSLRAQIARLGRCIYCCRNFRHHQLAKHRRMGGVGREDAAVFERSSAVEDFQRDCRDAAGCVTLPYGRKPAGTLINDNGSETAFSNWPPSACPMSQYTRDLGSWP